MTDTTRVNFETLLPVPGSQARHYDRANYVPQTRAALETLYGLLTSTGAKVVPISKAR